MTAFPTTFETIPPQKYQEALQHPGKVFASPRLQRSHVETKNGIPKVRTGGYALVYRLASRDNPEHREEIFALRCFREPMPDLADRYARISTHLDGVAARSAFFVSTQYLHDGIKIDGSWKPVTTMTWIDGEYLDVFLDRASSVPHQIAWLESRIRALADDLRRTGIAHGDLHHKNILISARNPRSPSFQLIDYDGMYVPALAKHGPREPGHEDYQHPDRAGAFGPGLDDFSLMVLYLNVVAVQRHPELWNARTRVEGLLTREVDYLDPDKSEILGTLAGYEDLRAAATAFKRVCLGPFSDIPPAREFFEYFASTTAPGATMFLPAATTLAPAPASDLAASGITPVGARASHPPQAVSPAVLERARSYAPSKRPTRSEAISTSLVRLRSRDGQETAVIGRFARSERGDGTPSSPYKTIYLEATGGATFEVMVDKVVARQFAAYNRDWVAQPGEWLWVRGLLLSDGSRFVIDLEQPANLAKVVQVSPRQFTFDPVLAARMRQEKQAQALRLARTQIPDLASFPARPSHGEMSTLQDRPDRPTLRKLLGMDEVER